jgi:hypothetical protein
VIYTSGTWVQGNTTGGGIVDETFSNSVTVKLSEVDLNFISYTESLKNAAKAVAQVVGYTGKITFVKPNNPLSEALAMNQPLSFHKAKQLLG